MKEFVAVFGPMVLQALGLVAFIYLSSVGITDYIMGGHHKNDLLFAVICAIDAFLSARSLLRNR